MTDPLTPVLTRGWLSPKSWNIDTYEQFGGYSALRTAVTAVPEQLIELVRAAGLRGRGGAGALRRGERPAPTRGAPLTDFKDAELQLAGFFQGRDADVDGPSAAAETLRGAQLAADRGWRAPAMPERPPAFPDVPVKE